MTEQPERFTVNGLTVRQPKPAHFRGHVFHAAAWVEAPGLAWDPAGRCEHCGLMATMSELERGMTVKPCPGTDEGRALITQEQAAEPEPITEPCLAVPADWDGTEAEAIGLAVAGAVAGIMLERDQARQELADQRAILLNLTAAYPATSWAGSNVALEAAREYLKDTEPDALPVAD